jgi:hypothetical protein
LGNELDTLKRASRELAEAGKAVQQELAQADPAELQKMRGGRGPKDSDEKRQEGGESKEGQGQEAKSGSENGDPQPGDENSPDNGAAKGEPQDGNEKPAGSADADQKKSDTEGEKGKGDQPGEGKQPGDPKSNQPGDGQKPGESPAKGDQPAEGGKPGQQPGQGKQSQDGKPMPGDSPSGKPQPGKGKPGEGKPGQSPDGKGEGQGSPSEQSPSPPSAPRQKPGLRPPAPPQKPSSQQPSSTAQQGGNQTGPGNPITGQGFVQWSDQIRNIEELIDDPKMRAEVARIREAARSMRAEFKRHSKEPQWGLVRMQILEPLSEIQEKLKEEIARRESPDSLVPIDRDPVPDKYAELVRRYYERIGSGK